VKMFEKNGNNYEIIRDTITTGNHTFSLGLDISVDGSAVAIGNSQFDVSAGKVYLYDTF